MFSINVLMKNYRIRIVLILLPVVTPPVYTSFIHQNNTDNASIVDLDISLASANKFFVSSKCVTNPRYNRSPFHRMYVQAD